jgi:hypothetical protein
MVHLAKYRKHPLGRFQSISGFELEVLKGAERTLGRAVGLECELSLAPAYEGQAPFRM